MDRDTLTLAILEVIEACGDDMERMERAMEHLLRESPDSKESV